MSHADHSQTLTNGLFSIIKRWEHSQTGTFLGWAEFGPLRPYFFTPSGLMFFFSFSFPPADGADSLTSRLSRCEHSSNHRTQAILIRVLGTIPPSRAVIVLQARTERRGHFLYPVDVREKPPRPLSSLLELMHR